MNEENKEEPVKTEAKKKRKLSEKAKQTFAEFKKFIAKGNVLDMAVGVIVGGAFSAVVTAVTNILMSLCTWGVPGGISGLVTVLPAVSASQLGYQSIDIGGEALKASYTAAEWVDLSQMDGFTSTIAGMYTLHGSTYYYNGLAIIDWGALINAVISFIIIALTLFIIVKVYTSVKSYRMKLANEFKAGIEKAKADLDAKNKEEVKSEEEKQEEKK